MPGVAAHGRRFGPVAALECQRAQPGLDVHHAQGVFAPARPRADRRRHRRRADRTLSTRSARSDCLGVRRAADRRPGHDRRLQAHHRGSRQPRAAITCNGSAIRSWNGATKRRVSRDSSTAPGRTRPGCTSRSTGPSAWPWACRSASSSTRCRSTWALTTSTTSTSSAGRGR